MVESRQAMSEPTSSTPSRPPAAVPLSTRLRVALELLLGLRPADLQTARIYADAQFAGHSLAVRWAKLVRWAWHQMWVSIPGVSGDLIIRGKISRTPMWLIDANPLANHPWESDPSARLPQEVDTVVIGAGFTGAALAYHWARRAPEGRRLLVLEMDDPASGSSGRNEGLVVMGRYFKMVHDTVLDRLPSLRPDLNRDQQRRLARQFAGVYCQAAYRNADMIEKTILSEGFDCDYSRSGWVQGQDALGQAGLEASVKMAVETGFTDWTSIGPEEVAERSGMQVNHAAGFSRAAASWHPAKWVWCLLGAALSKPSVALLTRTRVTGVEDEGERYRVSTPRGSLLTRHLVYATEAYTPKIYPPLHDCILPMQQQAASGDGGPENMKPHVGISGSWYFAGRYARRVLFGSGGPRVPDREAGRNQPSRFLTRFVAAEMKKQFGPFRLRMANEWSGTVSYTPDEYPIVGLLDGKRRHIIAGMAGSGSGVSFNGGRSIVNRILGLEDEPDDYPAAYFAPSRLIDPARHPWPEIEP